MVTVSSRERTRKRFLTQSEHSSRGLDESPDCNVLIEVQSRHCMKRFNQIASIPCKLPC